MAAAGTSHHNYTEREITQVLTCVAAWAGSISAAITNLQQDGDIEHVPDYGTINRWIRGEHSVLYSSIREQNLEQIERDLADRYRGVAAKAVEATDLAVEVATNRLLEGTEHDPARAAASLVTVADKALRNYALLEGKPTAIREDRTLPDVMRTLIDMGVLVPHAQPQIEETTEVEQEDA